MIQADWQSLHGGFFEGASVLVTGGAGFIGSHLTRALLALGCQVQVIDDLTGGLIENIAPLQKLYGSRLRFTEGSILDEALLGRQMAGCRWVFHQAALGSVPRSIEIPERYFAVNATGTFNVLEAARHSGIERVMFAASSSAYGNSETLPKIETMPALPLSPYAATKVAGEAMLSAYASCYETDTCALRYFNIFGPNQSSSSAYAAVIAAFAKAYLEGRRPTIYGDGEQSRDFTYVDNVVHANLLAARQSQRIGGKTINIACGQRITITELATEMASLLNVTHLKPEYVPDRKGDVKHSQADISRARSILGYDPIVDFKTGLQRTCEWYRGGTV